MKGEMHTKFRSENLKERDLDIRERGWVDVDWIHLAQDRDKWRTVFNKVMTLSVP
jgi:hypothetical protein